MMFLSFLPLVGVLSPFFFLTVLSENPASSIFGTRGGGVQSLDGPLNSSSIDILTNNVEQLYFTNITLGGLNLTVILDTGSSDLFVNLKGRDINLTNSTTVQTIESFDAGLATGNIDFADLRLGDFVISNQVFFDATKTNATQTEDLGTIGDGIIGMGFNADSSDFLALGKAFGDDAAQALGNTPMPALFAQQSDLSRSFDVALGRADALGDAAGGIFIISDHDANFQQVTNAPQLTSVSEDNWSVILDAMNINGEPFQFNQSAYQGVPDGKVAAILDTGSSFPTLPPPAVDAIYSSIKGAVFDKDAGVWLVPCNSSGLDLSFVFGGEEFFIHPLDLTFPVVGLLGANSDIIGTVCINTFQHSEFDPAETAGSDLVLGIPFLRNVYASFNYGDENTNPFVQLVSTTPNIVQAQQEFREKRAAALATLPPTVDPASVANKKVGQQGGNGSSGSSSQKSSPTQSASSSGASGTTTAQNSQPSKHGNGAGRDRAVEAWVLGATALLSGVFTM